jgi:Phosphodiester glycosidase
MAALAAGCSKSHHETAPAIVWSVAAPGLEVAKVPLEPGIEAWAVRFEPARFKLGLEWSATGLHIPDSIAPGYIVALNGGYFEPDLRPSGLLIDQGREVQARSGGSGVLVLENGQAKLLRLHDLKPSPSASVLQAWPFLIEPGGDDGIHRDDEKRSRRSAIGLDAQGRGLLVAVPQDGVSLYGLMQACRNLGAVVALNLDGGPSTGFALGIPPGWSAPSATEVSNALVLRARG